ncbi:hypothetical protein [Sphingopyxis sp. LC363]|uniref:hypothetical protein n=1 Tax=Sphingopyxis sp. SE2 TaxID=1586240 RepID=UPI001376DD19
MADAVVGAPFVHEMFHATSDRASRLTAAPQIADEAGIAHRVATEYARRHRGFLQKGLDPLQQAALHHVLLDHAFKIGRLTR